MPETVQPDLYGEVEATPAPSSSRPDVGAPEVPGGLRAFSYGGGVQSTAALVLAATGLIDFGTFLFANVGHDSERQATLRYVEEHAQPFADAHGISLITLDRRRRDGTIETLYGRLTKEGSRSLPIPVRMPDTGAPGTRSCTMDFKIRVIAKWLKANGATKDAPATIGVGISLDEIQRASRRPFPWERIVYPLLDHSPPLRRSDCERVIAAVGLPIPPKSACYFCPFHRPSTWLQMRQEEPEEFWKAVELERLLIKRRLELGRDPVYFTRFGRPLDEVIPDGVDALPLAMDDDAGDCDGGVCFT